MRESIGLQEFEQVDLHARAAKNPRSNQGQGNKNGGDRNMMEQRDEEERMQRRRVVEQQQQERAEDDLKVAPIISDHNMQTFKKRLFSTLSGFNMSDQHQQENEKNGQNSTCVTILNIFTYFLLPIFIVVPPLILTQNLNSNFDGTAYNNSSQQEDQKSRQQTWIFQHLLAVFIPVVLNLLLTLIYDVIRRKFVAPSNNSIRLLLPPVSLSRYLTIFLYSYLWAQHISIVKYVYYNNVNIKNNSDTTNSQNDPTNQDSLETMDHIFAQYIALLIFSILGILTSASTIVTSPVREFSASSLEYSYPHFHHHASHSPHSTLYMRFIIAIPFLVAQTGLYYRENIEYYYNLQTYLSDQSQTAQLISVDQYNPLIQYINGILCFTFVLWFFGMLSSFYNMCAFLVNRVGNGLIFGECSHGDAANSVGLVGVNISNSSNKSTWYNGFVIFLGNLCVIGINYGIFQAFVKSGIISIEEITLESGNIDVISIQDQDQMFRVQHITLVILCSLSGIIYALSLYWIYGCCASNKTEKTKKQDLLRGNEGLSYSEYTKIKQIIKNSEKPQPQNNNEAMREENEENNNTFSNFNNTNNLKKINDDSSPSYTVQEIQRLKQKTPKHFLSPTFITHTVLEILFCLAIALVIAFLHGQVSIISKQAYNAEEDVDTDRNLMLLILGIHSGIYLVLVVIFMELVRTRSKLGCQFVNAISLTQNANIKKEKIRDSVIYYLLRITGTVSVIFLIQRLQERELYRGIDRFTKEILGYSESLQQNTSQNAYNFVRYIVIPILILRTYKRLQYFNHSIHIAITLSFLVALEDTAYYQAYPYIMVVLFMPLFPASPFKMLLMSPLIIPSKLTHKNEGLYRILYYFVNIMSLFAFIFTLGLFQFTMVFGLPMYWLTIPSTYCGGDAQDQAHVEQENSQNNNSRVNPQGSDPGNSHEHHHSTTSPEYIIYKKFVQNSLKPYLPNLLKNKPPGYYLFRISKYIMLLEKSSGFYGLAQSFRVIGLEAQEVTTCHAKEGESIDKCIESAWPQGTLQIQQQEACVLSEMLQKVIHPLEKIAQVEITGENQIQLTGLIQTQAFYELFKKVLLKSVIYLVDHQVRENINKKTNSQKGDKFWWNENQRATIQNEFVDDVQILCPKMKYEEIFPFAFVNSSKNQDKKHFFIQCDYPNASALFAGTKNKNQNKNVFSTNKNNNGNLFGTGDAGSMKSNNTNGKKLPPITQNKNKKEVKGGDDFMDLLNNSSVASNNQSNQYTSEKKNMDPGPTIIQESKQSDQYRGAGEKVINKGQNSKNEDQNSIPGFNEEEIRKRNQWHTTTLILLIYSKILGKTKYLNLQKLVKYLKKEEQAIEITVNAERQANKNKQFKNILNSIASQSIGHALKISINKTLEGEEDAELEDFLTYTKSQFLGVLSSQDFANAVSNPKKDDIWTISYKSMAKQLKVKRLSIEKAPLYVFQVDSMVVRAVWNNLRFELLYAANDDDERYSIQTHGKMLRNLLVQACEEPYGYAGYYSSEIVNI